MYSLQGNMLVIDAVSEEDAGSYQCQAENAEGLSKMSPNIRVTVLGPPVFTRKPPALVKYAMDSHKEEHVLSSQLSLQGQELAGTRRLLRSFRSAQADSQSLQNGGKYFPTTLF